MSEIQGQPEPTTQAAAESTPNQEMAAAGSQSQQSTTEPGNVDLTAVDGDAYEQAVAGLLATQHDAPTGETAAGDAGTETRPTTETEKAPEEDEPLVQGKGYRPRLDSLPAVDKEAIALRKELLSRGEDVSLSECLVRVSAKYGAPAAQQQQAVEAPPAGRAPEEIKASIADLRTQYRAAAVAVDTVKMADITDQIDAAREELSAAQDSVNRAMSDRRTKEQQQQTTLSKSLNDSKLQARDKYPTLADPSSDLSKHWSKTYARMLAEGDPTIQSPNAPYLISVIAAAELGIVPTRKADTKAPPSTATANPQRSVQPAPGGARSSAPATTGTLDQRIGAVKSLDDYDALIEESIGN